MSAIYERMTDSTLAGEFAKKYFGKAGMARIVSVKSRQLGRSWDVFEVGVVSPSGDFVIKGSASYDYGEAFHNAGKYPDDHDPIYVRHKVGLMSRAMEPKPEQVEMFA